ncbi:alpha-amylase family glycosyl hydrolase [Flavobacterium taihuense]|uniref:1,4-alpha-glucan branching protein n=1 Tax=Flavobacterium taihuense TaxID=2857508 RepID=A0ABS6XQY5_9FLAO|nr:alpha-amylase family glycosyl hydrolase [Flavobacterium taihuense]MBW4359085.1 1,4-alpha-glucan branching protein [Flavobacterium taihuense]
MKKFSIPFVFIAFIFSLICCQNNKLSEVDNNQIDGHPAWIMQGNIYEVNVRQYTPEGTFNAFAKHLDRLKAMGVETIWFMPINPISKLDRKGTLGSYYAVSDYTAINPEFGTMADFKKLVQTIHEKGMKVLIDWVPNHTGADHRWITQHPDFFVKDSSGKPAVAFDWADTRQLNYKNPVLQDSMVRAMKYWIEDADIDGFRCDVAWNVPASFWKKSIPELKKMKNIFMLAEGDSIYLPKSGFDAVYPWHMFKMMEKVAKGEKSALALDSINTENETMYPKNTIQMYFTSNHDENSWNHADFGTFPGVIHEPFAVFTQTMKNSVPLIYSGQEEPVLRALAFFEKDPITFKDFKREKFYKTLLNLRKSNEALSANASFKKVHFGDDKAIYAYVREKGNKKVLVILNFSKNEQIVSIKDATLTGKAHNVFKGNEEILDSKEWKMKPWGYEIYEY